MARFDIPTFTLLRFERLRELGFGDLLDYGVFFEALKDPVKIARIVFQTANFEQPAPTEEEFLDSLQGDDVIEARWALFKAYKDFFPTPVRIALDNLIDPATATIPQKKD